jgi:hypothetical protein
MATAIPAMVILVMVMAMATAATETATREMGTATAGMETAIRSAAGPIPVKHIAAHNHLGEAVNVCEWAGTPIVMDLSALWCGPCHMASAYLATGTGQDPFSGIGPDLRTMIGDGTAIWLTFLVQDDTNGDATTMHAAAWDAMYHHDNIPVLNELDTPMLPNYLQVGCWPTAWVIDPELNFHGLDDCATWNQLAAMVTEFSPN